MHQDLSRGQNPNCNFKRWFYYMASLGEKGSYILILKAMLLVKPKWAFATSSCSVMLVLAFVLWVPPTWKATSGFRATGEISFLFYLGGSWTDQKAWLFYAHEKVWRNGKLHGSKASSPMKVRCWGFLSSCLRIVICTQFKVLFFHRLWGGTFQI